MSREQELLVQKFGLQEFRPGQQAVIGHLLAGRSAAAVFPTGSGKSLCYQLTSLLLDGLTVVVSPLIALMKDQIDRLQQRGIAAERLDSTLSAQESIAVMTRLRAGELRMLYVAPERFNNERFREAIEHTKIALFAVDEAHCISEWGHNFRPDYLKLAEFARRCQAERLLALTATATPQVLDDICEGFAIEPECAIRTGFYRPNLTVLTTPLTHSERMRTLVERLQTRPSGPTIIYVTLQRTAEKVAADLVREGFAAKAYHAGLEDADRAAVQDWFLPCKEGIVVATIAFGMGIDKADIRYVYHFNLPKSLENFSQEIGRAGRDGQASICEMFICPDDLNALENFACGDTPTLAAVEKMLGEIFSLGSDFDVSLYDLSARHDIKQLVVRTLLVYLDLDGLLQEGTPFYSRYQFKPLASSAAILGRFAGERREFLAQIFRQAEKAKTWFALDLDRASQATGQPRERVVRALDYLAEQGLLELKVEGVRSRFRRLQIPHDLEELAGELHERLVDREQRELARLEEVLDLASHDGCQVARLGEHFGEIREEPCGHCSWCLGGQEAVTLLPRRTVQVADDIWQKAAALQRQHAEVLGDPRSLARLLCGLASPHLSRKRLGADPLFGALSHVPFAEVMQHAAAIVA